MMLQVRYCLPAASQSAGPGLCLPDRSASDLLLLRAHQQIHWENSCCAGAQSETPLIKGQQRSRLQQRAEHQQQQEQQQQEQPSPLVPPFQQQQPPTAALQQQDQQLPSLLFQQPEQQHPVEGQGYAEGSKLAHQPPARPIADIELERPKVHLVYPVGQAAEQQPSALRHQPGQAAGETAGNTHAGLAEAEEAPLAPGAPNPFVNGTRGGGPASGPFSDQPADVASQLTSAGSAAVPAGNDFVSTAGASHTGRVVHHQRTGSLAEMAPNHRDEHSEPMFADPPQYAAHSAPVSFTWRQLSIMRARLMHRVYLRCSCWKTILPTSVSRHTA